MNEFNEKNEVLVDRKTRVEQGKPGVEGEDTPVNNDGANIANGLSTQLTDAQIAERKAQREKEEREAREKANR